jgi:GNAT superfamily N-acetyltransferase
MTVLAPMSETFFLQFFEEMAKHYADENVESGRWPPENALERSRSQISQLLPQGVGTSDNYLFEIKDDKGQTAGYIWFAVSERQGDRSAFIYEVMVFPEFRRQGHARAAFLQLEEKVRELGLPSIGLNAFYHNHSAQALYTSLGYAPTNMTMVKQLKTQ